MLKLCLHGMLDDWSVKTSCRYDNNIIQKLWMYQFICQRWHFFITPAWKQMCGNCWTETGDQSIYFSHVYWETTYKLRLYLSCNSSQVWPTRISGVIESVFRCSGPNSKSIVTLTRPMQRKNAPLLLLPPFCSIAATGDFYIDYRETKISSKSTIIETNADKCTQCQMHKDLKFSETSQCQTQIQYTPDLCSI